MYTTETHSNISCTAKPKHPHTRFCMKPCKMKAQNCALFSMAHKVCYNFPWKI